MLKVSAILAKIYPVKTQPVLQVSTWSLGGQDGSWHTHNECCLVYNCIYSMCRKFHQILTWITLSRHYLSSKSNFGGLDDGVILTFGMACGVLITNIPCDRHSLVVFPGHLEPPVMRYHIWTCQFWDFKKVTVTQKQCIIEKNFIRENFFKVVVNWTGDILAYSGPLKAF